MKTIVITGGSDGLGRAIATRLAPNHKVVIVSRNETALAALAAEIGCEYKVCDVRDYDRAETVVNEIGAIDCFINNAGIWLQGTLEETDATRIRETIDTNTLGTINCTKAVIPGMKKMGSGQIINVISQAGLHAKTGWPVYTASKWAITGFTKSIQQELEPFGITVMGFYPGTANTELFAKSGAPKDVSEDLSPDDVAKTIQFMVELGPGIELPEIGIRKLKTSR